MHKTAIVFGILICGLFTRAAQADPYRWCAEYGGGRGGGTNCYFVTLQQCQWAISGNGGFCRQNGFYDGLPVTPEAQSRRSQYRVR
jgi:hypothetical protein